MSYKDELEQKTTSELIEELKALKDDLEFLGSKLDDKDVSSEEKSELRNSDIPSARESIRTIEEILDSRQR